MKNRKKKYLHERKVAKRLAALALVATTLAQPTFGLVNVASVYAQEAAAPAANSNAKRTPIPFKTIYEEDPTLEAGKKRVRVKGVEGFKEVTTSTTPDVEAVPGKGSGILNFTTKAPVTTDVTNEYKPTVLDVVLDFSSSYRYKIFDSIDQAKMLINEALTNKDSKVIIQAYTYNSEDTYAVKKNGTGSNGYSTTLLTKQEALKILDELKDLVGKNPSISDKYFPSNFEGYFAAIEKTFGDKNYVLKSADAVVPFEDVVKEVTKPTDLISVIQFTDGWSGGEEVRGVTTPLESIDTSFAEWAKSRAKTFMSVVNKNVTKASDGDTDKDTNSEQSIKDMTRVGHPNIYDMTGKDRSVVDKELLAKFKETAVEKVTSKKGENQTAKITIGGDGTKVLTAKLKGATNKDLPIKDGKVDFSEKLADGSYTVEFTAEGNGTVTAKVAVDGKDVDTKTVTLKETAGKKGTSTSDEKITPAVDEIIQVGTKPVTKGSATPFKTIYEEDKELEAGKKVTKQEGSAGAGSIMITYTLNKQTGEVTPKETKSDKPAQDQIIKVGTKPKIVETKIPYETIEEKDPTLPEGVRKVKTPGKEGLKTVTTTYTLNTKTGEVTPKEDVKDVPKVDEVILVGTMKKSLPVTLRFFNRDKGNFLKEDQKITTDQSKFDDEFNLTPDKEIKDGNDTYRLVEIKAAKTEGENGAKLDGLSEDKKSLKGKVSEKEQVFDAIYERVVSTHYVDKDGKELEKSVEGVQDKKEIKGYKFVTTRKLQNGDIEHVYEKVVPPTPSKPTDTPKTFAKTGESNSLILTSLGLVFAGVLGFLGFKKYRSSKESTD